MQLIKIFNTGKENECEIKKTYHTAVAIACLTAFAANAQAAPRAVTIPKNAKSTVATAAAKIIKNNLKKGKSAKADDKTISARSVTKPKATAKNTVKTGQARKPAAKVNMAGLPKDYKKIGIFGEAEATKEQAAALIYLNNTDPQLNCSVDELVDLYWTEAGREGVREDIALAQAIIETGFFSFTGDVKPEQNNYCGLGTTGGGVEGEYFDEPEIGVRAHIQHLLAYTTKKHPSTDIVDPRYELAHAIRMERGIVDKWSGLNVPGLWAASTAKNYAYYQSMLTLSDKDLKEAEKAKAEYLKNYMGSHKDDKKDKKDKPERKLTMRERVEKILREGK